MNPDNPTFRTEAECSLIIKLQNEIEQLKAENICKDLKITIQHDKITALKSKLEIAKKGLEKIAYEGSSRELCTKICEQALKEINDDPEFAKCQYCKKPIDGHLAEHYKETEVFCSLKCNQEYMGD